MHDETPDQDLREEQQALPKMRRRSSTRSTRPSWRLRRVTNGSQKPWTLLRLPSRS
jgi:hypothetical protein